jgi:FkbM family methyltransferase
MKVQEFFRKVNTATRWRIFNPESPVVQKFDGELTRLGSKYGGKTVAASMLNSESIVISAGAGQDISFELELETKIKCKIYILDPTPSSVIHYEQILIRGRKNRTRDYSVGSKQEIDSYETKHTTFSNLLYIKKAIWNSQTKLNFYPPVNDHRDGSYSLSSIQNNYRKNKKFIVVTSTTLPILMSEYRIQQVDLLKLDIEGAALEVLSESFLKNVYPLQIHVEFDEMHFPGPKSFIRTKRLRNLLHSNNYYCVHRENCDFLYIRLK